MTFMVEAYRKQNTNYSPRNNIPAGVECASTRTNPSELFPFVYVYVYACVCVLPVEK